MDHTLIVDLALFGFVWFLYWPSLRGPFIFDDLAIINSLKHSHYDSPLKHFGRQFYNAVKSRSPIDYIRSRPLTWLSYRFDIYIAGQNAGRFHRTNVLLHSLTVVLAYNLLLRWTDPTTAGISALLFACHPLATSAVAYISGRASLLCTFFMLAALYCLDLHIYWAALLYALMAGLSKEEAVILPFLAGGLLWLKL